MRELYELGPDKEYPIQLYYRDGGFAAQYEPAFRGVIAAEGKTSEEALTNLKALMGKEFPAERKGPTAVDGCGADGYAYIGGGVKVIDHCRKLYEHDVACWVSDKHFANADQIEIAPGDFYLVHIPGDKKVGVIFPANNDQWRMQEFVPDAELISYMQGYGLWKDPQPATPR